MSGLAYVRARAEADALVGGDQRVRIALALAHTGRESYEYALIGNAFSLGDKARLVSYQLAGLTLVELCMLGYRIGWDSATAAAALHMTEYVGQPVGGGEPDISIKALAMYAYDLARILILDEHAEPWPFEPAPPAPPAPPRKE